MSKKSVQNKSEKNRNRLVQKVNTNVRTEQKYYRLSSIRYVTVVITVTARHDDTTSYYMTEKSEMI